MSGIGLAYKTPEQQTASTLDAGARAITQPPASPGIGLTKLSLAPGADPNDVDQTIAPVPDTSPVAAAPVTPQAAPVSPPPVAEKSLIDFHTNPLGAIGLVMSSVAAGINGTESPVEQLKKDQLEQQAQQYKTSSLALDIVGKYETILSKSLPGDHAGIIQHAQDLFGKALGGLDIKPILTAFSDGSIKNGQAKLQAAAQFLSPQALAVYANDPAGLDKLLTAVLEKKATQETPEEAAAKAKAIALAQGDAGAVKPMTPAEIAANRIAAANAGTSAATAAETKRHNTVIETDEQNKPLTQDQATAATYADRAHEANGTIDKLGATQGTSLTGRSLEKVPGGNYAQSPDYQKNSQAERNFVNAVLRKESGSAINPSEFDSAAKQYFPQPGDTTDVIKQKAVNRSTVINGLRREAGPSYKPPAPVIRYDAKGNRISD